MAPGWPELFQTLETEAVGFGPPAEDVLGASRRKWIGVQCQDRMHAQCHCHDLVTVPCSSHPFSPILTSLLCWMINKQSITTVAQGVAQGIPQVVKMSIPNVMFS